MSGTLVINECVKDSETGTMAGCPRAGTGDRLRRSPENIDL
jgi:hypothetical protein